MARVTIEDCLKNVDNRYELVHLATHRARQIKKGSSALVESKNKEVVTALREIAAKKVLPGYSDVAAHSVSDDDDSILPQ